MSKEIIKEKLFENVRNLSKVEKEMMEISFHYEVLWHSLDRDPQAGIPAARREYGGIGRKSDHLSDSFR